MYASSNPVLPGARSNRKLWPPAGTGVEKPARAGAALGRRRQREGKSGRLLLPLTRKTPRSQLGRTPGLPARLLTLHRRPQSPGL